MRRSFVFQYPQHAIRRFSLSIVTLIVIAAAPKQTITDAAIADEKDGGEKDEAANGARFTFQEETNQIQNDEHNMRLHECWIGWLRD